jgi:hypothetical protein
MNFDDEEEAWENGLQEGPENLKQSEQDLEEGLQREVVSLDHLERDWAEQLQSSSLVVQVQYRDQDAVSALKRLGYFFATEKTERILRDYPASFLVGLNYVASAQMEKGTLWPFIFSGLNNLESSQPRQESIARIHRRALNKFQLERFEHPLGRIGEIVLHAGIPVSSQEKFIRRLIRDYKVTDDFDGRMFNEGIRGISQDRVQASSIDKPIWHFINQAGAVADDFVSKCIEILDDSQDSQAGSGLPIRVIAEIQRVIEELGNNSLLRSDRKGDRVKPPRITWPDNPENELQVILPRIPESKHSAVRWTIEYGANVTTIDVAQEIPGIGFDPSVFELREPIAQLNIRSESLGATQELKTRSWYLSLYSEDNPVLFFDADGELDSGKGPLGPGQVKILYPSRTQSSASKPELSIEGESERRVIDAPLGWNADSGETPWLAELVDLSEAESVELRFNSLAGHKPFRRAVSAFKKPKPALNGLVLGIFDSHGMPVFSEFPELEVGSLSTGSDEWSYEIRDIERVLVVEQKTFPHRGRVSIDPPADLKGEFEFKISRGLGQTTTFTRTVLPGLSTSYLGEERKLLEDGTGLEEFNVTLSSPKVQELPISLSRKARSTTISDDRISSEPITLRPDYEFLELFNTRSRRKSEWIEPTRSNIENLTELQIFFASTSATNAALIGKWGATDSQILQAQAVSPRFKFHLGELSDAANDRGAFDLEIQDQTGRKLKAGKCYPKNLFNDFQVDDDSEFITFEFAGGNVPLGLQVAFYAPLAPWRAPFIVEVESSSIAIPEELVHFGALAFSMAVSSPWAPHDFGTSPATDDMNTGVFDSLPPDANKNSEQALTHWIMTGEKSPEVKEMGADLAWACFTKADSMSRKGGFDPGALKALAASILQQNPNSLGSYPVTSRGRHESLIDMIDSGMVALMPMETQLLVDQQLGRPVLACIGIASADLESTQLLLDSAADAWGVALPSSEESLELGPLEVHAYKLGLLNFMSPGIRTLLSWEEDFFREHAGGYLPGKLMEGGTMFVDIFSRLGFDTENLLTGLGSDWTDEVASSLRNFDSLIPETMKGILKSRPILDKNAQREIKGMPSRVANWPAISIRMALAARTASRGSLPSLTLWEANKSYYLKMAKALPSLVEIDLTIAELALRQIESES